MNLIPSKFRFRQFACNHNSSTGGIDLDSVLKGEALWEEEEFLQHFHHIIVGVLIIVQKNYVIERSVKLLF